MDQQQDRAAQKKKEREGENAQNKLRTDAQERDEVKKGGSPSHVLFIAVGAVLVLIIVLVWTLSG